MSAKQCPMCGEGRLERVQGEFRFEPPPNIPGGSIIILSASWLRCTACHEIVIPHALDQAIDAERNRRMGLLAPSEIRRVREKAG